MSASEKSLTIEDGVRAHIMQGRNADIDEVTSRECSSDRFSGVQIKVYGDVVPIRPVIDYVAEQDGIAIEGLYHATDTERPHLGMFIAYLPEHTHPAFI